MADLLTSMTSAELTGWVEYLRIDDEVKAQWTSYAIAKAFNGDRKQQQKTGHRLADKEEIIDTTDPEFAKHFAGFSHTPQPQRTPRNSKRSTEIKLG